jgi:mono/diheme cytochrome c family protein
MKNLGGLFKRVGLTLAVLAALPLLGMIVTFELIKVDWVSFMEIQPSYRPMEDPLPVPEGSVPIQGAAFVPGAGAPENPVPADDVSLGRGRQLYDLNCTLCHGAQGKGDGPVAEFLRRKPANLTEAPIPAMPDGDIFLAITNGVTGAMPALRENLPVRDRWDVVNYVRKLQGK